MSILITFHPKEVDFKVERVQRVLEWQNSLELRCHELELHREIKEVLKHEELLWFQKSKSIWLRNGDRNTSYFHSRTLAKRKRNKIKGLIIENGDWCFDVKELKQHVVIFSRELYTVDYLVSGVFSCHVFNDEIRKVIFGKALLKAPEVDGFQVKFFQFQWDIVGPSGIRQWDLLSPYLFVLCKRDWGILLEK
ncbi:hypothetical protein J1N35_023456 [Gossypium stocksii]|uniref:Reverse transcriptase domain-containing protein n=1 Tax=Gossypium stocksii TaxID=47602 RepID=A0A9D4A3X8_9ROSI|nr:hypothetical protein J1N35_023456 [Gossypium stocksii]